MTADEFAGIGERISASLQMCVPHRKGVDHVGPDLERYGNPSRTGGCGKACGIIEQSFAGPNLDQCRRQSLEIREQRRDTRVIPLDARRQIGFGQFGKVSLVN